MANDDLYQLAVQGGLFPTLPGGDLAGQELDPALAGNALGGTLTPPEAPTSPLAPPGPPTSSSHSNMLFGSVSQSGRGFDPNKYGQVKGTEKDLYQNYARIDQEAAGMAERQIAPLAGARNSLAEATRGVADATVEEITAEGAQANMLQGLQAEFAAEELKMNAEAEGKSQEAKADYMAALADFRASRVNPAQLWGNMTEGQRFGTLVTAFVHDFLGVRGMKTSAMDTLNKAIDRNIDSQLQAIRTKGEVAEGFKSLWWMQRNQSASDAEARARVRGFMLESAKQQVIANMAKYKAGLVTAQGQAAIAAIDKEFAKNLVEIYRGIDHNIIQMKGQAIQQWKAKLDAANQSWANAIASKRLDWDKQKYNDELTREARKAAMSGLIPDVSKSGGGAMRWQFREGITPQKQSEVLEQVAATGSMVKNVEEYRKMLREYNSINDATAKTRFANTHGAKMRELQVKIVLDDTLRRTGKAATQQEREAIESRLPLNTWATLHDVETIAAGFEKHGIEDMNTLMQTYAYDLPEGDFRREVKGAQGGFARAEEIDAAATHATEGRGPADTGTDQGTRAVVARDSMDITSDSLRDKAIKVGVAPEREWERFKKSNPAMARDMELSVASQADFDTVQKGARGRRAPAMATGMAMLGKQAETDPAARAALNEYARLGDVPPTQPLPDGTDPNSKEGRYKIELARFYLNELK